MLQGGFQLLQRGVVFAGHGSGSYDQRRVARRLRFSMSSENLHPIRAVLQGRLVPRGAGGAGVA